MPKETAYEKDENLKPAPNLPLEDDELRNWLSFAKTQAVTTELLQFELDALADALEFKARSVIEAFEELVNLMQQNPQFADNEDVSKSLSSMVRSLQFQDIAKQKLENISNALTIIYNFANDKISLNQDTLNVDCSEIGSDIDNVNKIISERTLAEMRKSMKKNLEYLSKTDFERLNDGQDETLDKEDSGTNVELF